MTISSDPFDPNTSRLSTGEETQRLRQKIRQGLATIEIDLDMVKGAEIERRTKALTSLFKLTQALDEHEEKQACLRAKKAEKFHTLYAQIPPPNDDEMRVIQDRLNRVYDRLRNSDATTKNLDATQSDGPDRD